MFVPAAPFIYDLLALFFAAVHHIGEKMVHKSKKDSIAYLLAYLSAWKSSGNTARARLPRRIRNPRQTFDWEYRPDSDRYTEEEAPNVKVKEDEDEMIKSMRYKIPLMLLFAAVIVVGVYLAKLWVDEDEEITDAPVIIDRHPAEAEEGDGDALQENREVFPSTPSTNGNDGRLRSVFSAGRLGRIRNSREEEPASALFSDDEETEA